MNILLIGGSGFIGSHLTRRLLSLGHRVTIFDLKKPRVTGSGVCRPDASEASWYNPVRFIGGDVTDFQQVYYAVDRGDVVVNLAAISQFAACDQNPHIACAVNVAGAANVAHACAANKASHLVYISTGSVYSPSAELPITEDAATGPFSLYGKTKLWAEEVHQSYESKLPVTILRLPHVVGPGKTWGANSIIVRLLANERPVIFGDGSNCSDFTYVEDVVQAIERALLKPGGVYNIGSGDMNTSHAFLKLAKMFTDKTHIEPLYQPRRSADFKDFVFDISKARKELGYAPAYDLEKALRKTVVEWEQWL